MSYTYDQLYAYNGELLDQLDALSAVFDVAMQQAAATRRELREIELDLSKQLEALRAEYNVLFEQREKLRSDYDELSAEYHAMRDAHVKRNLDLLAENAYLRTKIEALRNCVLRNCGLRN